MVYKKKLAILLLSVLLILTSCSSSDDKAIKETGDDDENFNASGMPIMDETITMDVFAGTSAQTNQSNWNDILIWNKYKDMTNIDVKWNQVSIDALEEKRNLALASGDLPDIFYAASISSLDLLKYGEQGVFLPLNDLIDKYAPNLKALLEENPEVEKALTFPDGNIYSLPNMADPDFISLRVGGTPWFNEEWLDVLGMDVPETTDEFYEYLKAVKTEDPNGNGKNDEIPYGGDGIGNLIHWLQGSFGINTRGGGYIDADPKNGDMRFVPETDGYKEMLTYLNKLYSEGLIEQNIFSIDWNQYLSNASEEKYGTTVFWSPDVTFAGDTGKKYVSGYALEGPNGDKLFAGLSSVVTNKGQFVITKENENPAAAIRWADYFYGDEGSKLMYMGVEGETYEKKDDGYQYLDKITNSKEGLTSNQEISKYLTWVGVGPPALVKQDYFVGSESAPSALEAAEKLEPNLPDEVWPAFTYTEEENKMLSSVGSDIEKYVDEMRDKFITGDASFSEWDKYVKTLDKMGLDDYMDIQKEAYKRYKAN
jgi:putative aldouronate transport system substrate-binding protein